MTTRHKKHKTRVNKHPRDNKAYGTVSNETDVRGKLDGIQSTKLQQTQIGKFAQNRVAGLPDDQKAAMFAWYLGLNCISSDLT
jgi:hypothetical protein